MRGRVSVSPASAPPLHLCRWDWVPLGSSGLMVTAVFIPRAEMGYLKSIYESWDGVAITRMAARADAAGEILAAIVSTPDLMAEADAILSDYASRAGVAPKPAVLPPSCHEDWFLREWA